MEICGGDMLIEGFISIEDSGIPTFVIKQPDANWDEVLFIQHSVSGKTSFLFILQ
ncbi:MAG: hypothetical protein GNW80_15060 [Asgard group archaeon]|nr:hypothetical protein [Asgard group archaeon]